MPPILSSFQPLQHTAFLQWLCQQITPKNCFYIKPGNLQKCMDVCI